MELLNNFHGLQLVDLAVRADGADQKTIVPRLNLKIMNADILSFYQKFVSGNYSFETGNYKFIFFIYTNEPRTVVIDTIDGTVIAFGIWDYFIFK